mgnify:FL=1
MGERSVVLRMLDFDYDFTLLLLVFMRMSGCVLFNPILGRRNLPPVVKIGLSLMLTLFSYRLIPPQNFEIHSFLVFFVLLFRELLIGFLVGAVIQMFLSVILISGETMDMQIGISMSRIYDPQSNVSMPLSASLINAMFFLIFFATNSHITLIRLFVRLCTVLPYGSVRIPAHVFGQLSSLLSLILIYAVKMAFPVLAAQLITEFAVGLVMRAVPQIDVFVINIQVKVILGFLILMMMVAPLSSFLERLITLMFDYVGNIFQLLT